MVEVSSSSVPRDLKKFPLYRDNGVREYVVWTTAEREILWFRRMDGEFVQTSPDKDGVFRSAVFPRLCLDVSALVDGNLKHVMSVLRDGLASDDHVEFVKQLAHRKSEPD